MFSALRGPRIFQLLFRWFTCRWDNHLLFELDWLDGPYGPSSLWNWRDLPVPKRVLGTNTTIQFVLSIAHSKLLPLISNWPVKHLLIIDQFWYEYNGFHDHMRLFWLLVIVSSRKLVGSQASIRIPQFGIVQVLLRVGACQSQIARNCQKFIMVLHHDQYSFRRSYDIRTWLNGYL